MCGIYFQYTNKGIIDTPTKHECLKVRGPDNHRYVSSKKYFAAFYRLNINSINNGMQPFIRDDILIMCNGEIYNHEKLRQSENLRSGKFSDCAIIPDLYEKLKNIHSICRVLNGEFSFVMFDEVNECVYFYRDQFGRKSLYYTVQDEDIEICSLVKGFEYQSHIKPVMPGILYEFKKGNINMHIIKSPVTLCDEVISPSSHYNRLVDAVYERTNMCDKPVGFLLSGGLDSSSILAISMSINKWVHHAFTIGFSENAPDIISAGIVVEFLQRKYGKEKLIWHKIIYSDYYGLSLLPDVICAIETYDTTTVRASTPMYIISKYISENTNIKVILSGEGSDELFGGYLYFKYAPNNIAFQNEIQKLLENIHAYDVLRADKSTACHGLEVRTPFLDDNFVEYILKDKMLVCGKHNTKELLRTILMTHFKLLPDSIIFGKKEAFSDAVGSSWKKSINFMAENFVKTLNIEAKDLAKHIPAETDEMKCFQYIFKTFIGNKWNLLNNLWLPNQTWISTGVEPSATILPNYKSAE